MKTRCLFLIFCFLLNYFWIENVYAEDEVMLPKISQIKVSEFISLHEQQISNFINKKKLLDGDKNTSKYIMLLSYIRGTSDATGAYYIAAGIATKTLDEERYNCINASTEKIITDMYRQFKSNEIKKDETLLNYLMFRYIKCVAEYE